MLAAHFGNMSSFICFRTSAPLGACKTISGALGNFTSSSLHPCTSLPFDLLLPIAQGWLNLLYKPLADPFSPILMARATLPTTPKLLILWQLPSQHFIRQELLSAGEEPQHWQQWQPWPAKMFLELYFWRLAESLTELAVTAEHLPGRFAQKKEMGCGRVWWWGEKSISEHIPIFSHIFLTP